ncbi:30S ribosomal protein S6 [Treponema zioleckii]|jgi:small subunit ribosomal protein S6|uniref:30S ribosomal protein S6 n=1 Tax=Treponema zioleckii TaxID=331680 RepID=UPI00168BEEED|nr:30S ribosomal protein S6 [Treponema zioleckii]
MKKYELMTIYPIEEDKFKAGTDLVRSVLAQFGATVEKEEPYGDRDLAYEINKQKRGRFVLFTVSANPAKLVEINAQFRLNNNLLKSLFVKLDDEKNK